MLLNDTYSQKLYLDTVFADESEVWQEFISGSKTAFSWLYHQYFNDLYHYSYRFIADEEAAKDNVQDFFAYLWEKRNTLPIVATVKPYLLKALRNRTLNVIKKGKRNQLKIKHFADSQPSISFSQEDFVVEEEKQSSQQKLIANLLNQLPERRKEAVYLRYFKNLSYAEIADIMSLTEKAVINHIYKAFRSLKKNEALKNMLQSLSVLFCASLLF